MIYPYTVQITNIFVNHSETKVSTSQNVSYSRNAHSVLDLSNPLGLLIYYTETAAATIRSQKRWLHFVEGMQLVKKKKKKKKWGSLFSHNIKSDIERFINNCDQCQKKEKIKKVLTDLQRILVKSEVLQQISVDIVSNILSNIFWFQDLDHRSITS